MPKETKRPYIIVMHSHGYASVVELTPAEFVEKVSKTIRDYLSTGRTEERTRELMRERMDWASQIQVGDYSLDQLIEFERETIRQLDTGEWREAPAPDKPTVH